MLTQLHIRDLAIVSRLETDFLDGMTVLTGETGAGKSILIDGLGLALGERADRRMIRAGTERAEVTAAFDLAEVPAALEWLKAQALDDGTTCLLRRVLTRDGSRAFVNGTPVPVRSLQALGNLLVDIHGQHAHQSLLHRPRQREALDGFGGLAALAAEVAARHREWSATRERLAALREDTRARAERIDLLRFQAEELARADLRPGESAELDTELRRLAGADRLRESCGRLLMELYEDEGAVTARLERAAGELREASGIDTALAGCAELIETAAIQVDEAVSGLRDALDAIESDPARLARVEERIGELQALARKYRCGVDALPDQQAEVETRLQALLGEEADLSALEQREATLRGEYEARAAALHGERLAAGERLAHTVTDSIRALGMPQGRFEVSVEPLPPEKAGAHGTSRVEFLVSVNPGQPPQPLAAVASGGELSRISLALQVATIRSGAIPTLIFDEVDVGIGGGVAEIVGRLLRELGEARQTLCVTHLPQVAALGHRHLRVVKASDAESTTTDVFALDEAERVEEIARMLGGVEITDRTRAHAAEMLGGPSGR